MEDYKNDRTLRLEQLRDDFDNTLQKIESALQAKYISETQKQAAFESMQAIESTVDYEILFATEDGKLKYSNQSQRENAKYQALRANDTYCELKNTVEERKAAAEQLKNQLEVLNYRFKALQSKVQIEGLLLQDIAVTAKPKPRQYSEGEGEAETENQKW